MGELANAVILQAVKDYQSARRRLKKHPKGYEARIMRKDYEQFFRSQWIRELTDVGGEYLLRKLEEKFV